jgi:hypothetical protein
MPAPNASYSITMRVHLAWPGSLPCGANWRY